jgi:hypothetical protein
VLFLEKMHGARASARAIIGARERASSQRARARVRAACVRRRV